MSEAKRLEKLWAGPFGNKYLERNKNAGEGRQNFWKSFLAEFSVQNALEVGCNVGANLQWIAPILKPENVCGIDINESALKNLRRRFPGVRTVLSAARQLPFKNSEFDLVFTAGVLIHQSEEGLFQVMSEMLRCSRRYVLSLEYFSKETEEVFYRGKERALFKRDYGRLYGDFFPKLALLRKGELTKAQGWDDVTYWIFEKPHASR